MTINNRVFALLEERGKTQKALADAIGVNERNVGSWKMRGTDPPAKLIYPIAAFFDVSVAWLLTGEEHEPPSFVNNGSVSGNLGPNSGSVYVLGEREHMLSAECAELVRVYESLGVRDRIRLLDSAFQIADASAAQQNPTEGGGV